MILKSPYQLAVAADGAEGAKEKCRLRPLSLRLMMMHKNQSETPHHFYCSVKDSKVRHCIITRQYGHQKGAYLAAARDSSAPPFPLCFFVCFPLGAKKEDILAGGLTGVQTSSP